MPTPITPGPADALLVIDLQNDFCPGGHLPVERGDQIVPLINRLGRRFAHVLLTQDWHPAGHISFASSHPGAKLHDTITAPLRPASPLARPLPASLLRRRLPPRPRPPPRRAHPPQRLPP
ncbi:MAG TPA: hypothetical protein VH250_03850, partial [Granulicella sp.]|nr:hypothetical protein [Granulicella sp.]